MSNEELQKRADDLLYLLKCLIYHQMLGNIFERKDSVSDTIAALQVLEPSYDPRRKPWQDVLDRIKEIPK